jgi:hypothetical protein
MQTGPQQQVRPLQQGGVVASQVVPVPEHIGQVPQSAAQPVQSSVASHVPSPQKGGHAPQSAGQLVQSSIPIVQIMSPHGTGHGPQSAAQPMQSSVASHVPSPQAGGQAPQSVAQTSQLSAAPQTPSPQKPPAPPLSVVAPPPPPSLLPPAPPESAAPPPPLSSPRSPPPSSDKGWQVRVCGSQYRPRMQSVALWQPSPVLERPQAHPACSARVTAHSPHARRVLIRHLRVLHRQSTGVARRARVRS